MVASVVTRGGRKEEAPGREDVFGWRKQMAERGKREGEKSCRIGQVFEIKRKLQKLFEIRIFGLFQPTPLKKNLDPEIHSKPRDRLENHAAFSIPFSMLLSLL